MLDLEAIRAHKEAAYIELKRLCQGGRWQMSIPAQPNYDSDLIIGAALRDMFTLIEEVERLRAAPPSPSFGDRAICSACGAPIEYIGPYWRHVGPVQLRHVAEPKEEYGGTIEHP